MPRGRLSYPSHIPAYSGSWEETRQPVGNPWGHVESIGNCGESVSWAQDQTLDLWVDNTAHCPACWPESVLHYYSKSATFKVGQSTQIVSWLKLSCCSKINTPFPNPNPPTFVLDKSYPPTSSPLSYHTCFLRNMWNSQPYLWLKGDRENVCHRSRPTFFKDAVPLEKISPVNPPYWTFWESDPKIWIAPTFCWEMRSLVDQTTHSFRNWYKHVLFNSFKEVALRNEKTVCCQRPYLLRDTTVPQMLFD